MRQTTCILVFLVGLLCLPKANAQADDLIKKAWEISEKKLDSAIFLCRMAYQISKEKGDLRNMGRAMVQRATFYDTEGKIDSSLFLFQKSINILEAIKDTAGLGEAYNHLGIFHFTRYHMLLAEKYIRLSYDKYQLIDDRESAARALVNLGIIESDKPDDPNNKALEYFAEAENYYLEMNDSDGLQPLWANKSVYYYTRGQLDEALALAKQSLTYNPPSKSNYAKVSDRILIASILLALERNAEAENYMLEALQLAEESHLPERRQYVYQTLAQIYAIQKNYEKAYGFMGRYIDLRDTIINENTSQQIASIEAMYGVEKQKNEINRLKIEAEQNEISRLKKEKIQNTYYFILIGAGIGVLILAVVIFLLFNNLKLEKVNSQLLGEKKQTAELLLEKEKLLMRESHHRIKNNLQLINSILDLQSRNIQDPMIKKTFTESMQRIQAISFAHQRLYGNETVEKLDLSGFVTELIHSIESSLVDGNSGIKINIDIDELSLSTEKAIPIGLIVNELLTNAIKYAFSETGHGLIRVSIKVKNPDLELVVEDNGKGMEDNVKGSGFGHQLVKSMTRQLKAKYSISLERGVKHIFMIPLS